MINIAVIGYGNIGKYAIDAVLASPDMNLAGVVRRELPEVTPPELSGIKTVTDISELGKVDTVLLAVPSRSVPEYAKKYLAMGINTIDSFDIHSRIYELKTELTPVAVKNGAVAVVSAGWDPGSDSVVRALMEALAPKGVTHTNFGEGMSMGHTVAVKSKTGVKDALSITVPLGTGIHRRIVYVELEDGADFEAVRGAIKQDPYFMPDETHIISVENVAGLVDVGHGVNMVRKGVSGQTHNQHFEYNMKINNPALTAQVMVSCARAASKRAPGCYTMPEIPVIDLLYGKPEDIIRRLV